MSNAEIVAPDIRRLGLVKRKAVGATALVRTSYLPQGTTLPLIVEPAVGGVDLSVWVAANREWLASKLREHGGLLFRRFSVTTSNDFEHFIKAVGGEPLAYRERSSPRSLVSGNIYTSTDHPANQSIFLHNENSYQQIWPLKIFFFCATPAKKGGATPIADVRKVLARIEPRIREEFARKQWMYVRNFGDGFGLEWPTVFETTDRAAVERHCRAHGIKVEWKEGNRLRTRAVRPALARHPHTSELVWFNHATFFHVTTLEPSVRELLLAEFKEEDLPTNTFYGDGSPIAPADLDAVRAAYADETVLFPWHAGDILLLDNMLVAHGRTPYTGPREILVGMAEPWSERGLQACP